MTSPTGIPELDWIAGVLIGADAADTGIEVALNDRRRDHELARLAVLPSARAARLLVDDESPPVLAGTLVRSARGTDRKTRIVRRALAGALRLGAGRLLVRDRLVIVSTTPQTGDDTGTRPDDASTLLAYLRTAVPELGRAPHSFAITTGPVRPNRKPVVQVMSPDGALVAFAKIGCDPSTSALIRNEAAQLTELERRPIHRVRTPQVMHSGTWRGLEVLAITPLPPRVMNAPAPAEPPLDVTGAVAGHAPTLTTTLSTSDYWSDLMQRLDALEVDNTEREALGQTGDAYAERPVPAAFAHGDWAPWNMAVDGDDVYVWDWERARAPVPIGFDLAHWAFQTHYMGGTHSVAHAAAAAGHDLADYLTGFEPRAADVDVVLALYLAELLVRYCESSLVNDPKLERARNELVTQLTRIS